MERIESTITARKIHQAKVEDLLISTEIEISKMVVDAENGIVQFQINGVKSWGDLRLEVIFDHLRQQGISYSYIWHEPGCKHGGERHYRSNGKDEQYLFWMDYEKNVVNIEEVRQAITQGDTAVLELLEATENNFTPWDWSEVAA